MDGPQNLGILLSSASDKDITEQTKVDIIKVEGGIVDDLDELGKADSFLFLLPTAY